MRKAKTIFSERAVNFCPRCDQPFLRQQGTGDFQHTCNNNTTLQNESIAVIGNWEDFTGSNVNTQTARLNAPAPDQLRGTRAGIEGGRNESRDARGFPTSRYRSRQHIEYIDADQFKANKETSQSDIEEHA